MANSPSTAPALMSVSAAAAYIGVSRSGFYNLLAVKSLPARKLGGRTLINRADLDAFLNSLPAASFRAPPKKGAR